MTGPCWLRSCRVDTCLFTPVAPQRRMEVLNGSARKMDIQTRSEHPQERGQKWASARIWASDFDKGQIVMAERLR